MSGSVFYYKIIIFGNKKAQSFTYSALLCCQQYCTAKHDVKFFFTAHTSFSLVLF